VVTAGEVPGEATQIVVTPDGRVVALLADGTVEQVGSIPLVDFENPGALAPAGGGLFGETPASGPPLPGASGSVVFAAVGESDVDVASESVSTLFAQAAIEANLAALESRDAAVGELVDVLF
jgi:flagellar basal-body rod protein FlgG